MSGQSAGSSTSLTALRQLQGAETPGPAVLTDLAGSVTPSWVPRRRLSPTARGSTEPRPSLPKSPSAPPASPFGAAGSRRLAPADSPVAAAPRAPSLRQRTPAEPPAALPSRVPPTGRKSAGLEGVRVPILPGGFCAGPAKACLLAYAAPAKEHGLVLPADFCPEQLQRFG